MLSKYLLLQSNNFDLFNIFIILGNICAWLTLCFWFLLIHTCTNYHYCKSCMVVQLLKISFLILYVVLKWKIMQSIKHQRHNISHVKWNASVRHSWMQEIVFMIRSLCFTCHHTQQMHGQMWIQCWAMAHRTVLCWCVGTDVISSFESHG